MIGPLGSTRDSTQNKFRILIVEHDIELARLLLTSLAAADFECHHAPDGAAGITSFHSTHPHLILLNLGVPRLTGRELCAHIRETSLVPIIALGDENSEAEQLEIFKLGADDYVAKPISAKLLVARTLAFLRRVYRYDPEMLEDQKAQQREQRKARDEAQRQALGAVIVPPGWASCGTCSYMGPRERFERFNPEGAMVMICPNCHHKEDISFSIG